MPRIKTRSQLADELEISRKTLYNWCREAGIDIPPGLLSPRTVAAIRRRLGFPPPPEPEKPSRGRSAGNR